MLKHYIKIAFRNLWKYKTQSLISILGLAVGFACFALASFCILISVFGFFSLVSLNLEERRKEMAIRKVNGATPGNILQIYFKEYFLLLLIGSLIAFPIAYFIMKQWLMQYIHQTRIDAWIYILILFTIALVIALCTGWRIWRSSKTNPSETLKSN